MKTPDNRELTLALSVGFLVTHVPLDPFGTNLYLTASTYGFVMTAVLNHLFPHRFGRLTHVVKAFYTHLLCASVGIDVLFGLVISVVDLLPLGVSGKRRAVFEGIGATARLGFLGWGFVLIRFNPVVVMPYALFSALYYLERKKRLAEQTRSEYGWLHHFEHLAIWIYFYAVNQSQLNLPFVHYGVAIYVGGVALVSVAAITSINIRTFFRWQADLPSWFDETIVPQYRRKVSRNLFSLKWYNHIAKSFDYAISLERMSWDRIEQMIDETEVEEKFDLAIGIFSGGAFIARRVCNRLGIDTVCYIESKNWSGAGLIRTVSKILRYHLGKPITCERIEVSGLPDVTGKRILLIDVTITTGTTMEGVRLRLEAHGAAQVKTYALICNLRHSSDYAHSVAPVPFIWPWGAEVD